MRRAAKIAALIAVAAAIMHDPPLQAADTSFTEAQQTALDYLRQHADVVRRVNRLIWEFAELGLEEHKSSAALIEQLEAAGFTIRRNVADMPTAFVASYGRGRPIIGILAEYDALPGMSQDAVPFRKPIKPGAPGHACGHSGLGAGALGAALAVRQAIERHGLQGTVRLYGTPAEETAIGKVYMLLAGEFKDLDVCLHWHPSTKNGVWAGSSKALVSAKFTFHGLSAHASGNPEKGRSALDAVELMNVGVNYMREHVREDARMHYVITDGGGAPNVVPATATVWYFVRADTHKDVERYFKWVVDIARGAALMTRTTMEYHVDTDCHELIPNLPLSELLHTYLHKVEPPTFTAEELEFARRLQQPLAEEFGTTFSSPLETKILSLQEARKPSKGSTDVGDISWFVPTGGIRTTCFAAGSPGHSWQNVACIGSSIGEKGTLYAARVLAVTAIHLLQNPQAVAEARADFRRRMANLKYSTLIPEGQKPPVRIR